MDTIPLPSLLTLLGGEQIDSGLRRAFHAAYPTPPTTIALIGWGFSPHKPRAAAYRLGLAADALGVEAHQIMTVMPGETLPTDSSATPVFCGGNPVVLTRWIAANPVTLPNTPIIMQAGSAAAVGSHVIHLQSAPPLLDSGLGWITGYAVIPHADRLLEAQLETCRRLLAEAGIKALLIDEDAAAQLVDGFIAPLGTGSIRIMTPDGGTMLVEAAHPMRL